MPPPRIQEPPCTHPPRTTRSSTTSSSMSAMSSPSIKSTHRQSSIFASAFSKWTGRRSSSGETNSIRAATIAGPPHIELVCAHCLRDFTGKGAELECGHNFHIHCIKNVHTHIFP